MFCVKRADGTCREVDSIGDGPPVPVGGSAIAITAPVGTGGVNRADDTSAIQDALNRVGPGQGGPPVPLAVDGICGPLTKQAIQKFQLRHFGWSLADGRVDPNGPTLGKLNALLGVQQAAGGVAAAAGSAAPPTGDVFEQYHSALSEALFTIRAASVNLDFALNAVFFPKDSGVGPTSQERLAIAERHFQISAFPDRAAQIVRLRSLFQTMLSVFARPGNLWGWYAFQPENPKPIQGVGYEWLAYTYVGGFYKPGQKLGKERLDTIYLCQRGDVSGQPKTKLANTIVHELAHFVSGGAFGAVEDFRTYGWRDTPQMQHLTPWQRVHHAESIMNFAFAARWNIPG